jgi:nitrate reductase delta subunit
MRFPRHEPDPLFLARLENIQGWTRKRFGLPQEAAVLVSEVACTVPGCPPLETVVAFWTEGDRRHQFKLYKPMAEVAYDDIGWLFGSPTGHEGAGWDCC